MFKNSTAKLSLSLFGSAILGLVLSSFIVIMSSVMHRLIIKLFFTMATLLIYGGLIYATAWREGGKDANKVKFGRMEKFMLKGLAAGALASVPFLIIYLLYLISSLTKWHPILFPALFRIFNMYLLDLVNFLILRPFVSAVFLIPLPFFSCFGYCMGYGHKSILYRLVYKKKK